MARNFIEDVVPPDRKSIRRIPVPDSRGRRIKPVKENPEELEREAVEPVRRPQPVERKGKFEIPQDSRAPERRYEPSLAYVRESYDPEPLKATRSQKKPNQRGNSWWLWLIALGSVIVLFLAFSFFFSGTKVTLTAHEETATLDTELTATKNNTDGVSYEVMTLDKVGDKTVPATGKEEVHRKASGTIIVYNNESSTEQKLVRNTRFESPDGLIFRTPNEVSIPGKKTEGGKIVPGSIEVLVYADQSGEKYNIGKVDLTIPGFKGDAKYKTVYARSKTAMTGGFDGQMNAVAPDVLEAARATLRGDLAKEILSGAKGQKPEGTIVFDSLANASYESMPETNSTDGGSVTLHEKVSLSIALFTAESINKAIGSAINASSTVSVTNLDSLQVAPTSSLGDIDNGSFSFTMRGAPHSVSVIDTAKVKQALLGKPRGSIFDILSSFPEIAKAEVSFRPFWRRSFPADPTNITVIITNSGTI